MKIKFFPLLLLSLGLMLFIIPAGHSQTLPKAKLPVLTTSAGQSPDVTTVNIILEEAGIGYDYCDVPTVEILAAGVGLGGRESGVGFHAEVHTDLTRFPQGTPYRTVIFAIGASLKGMGASGLTVEAEEARLKNCLNTARLIRSLPLAFISVVSQKEGQQAVITNG